MPAQHLKLELKLGNSQPSHHSPRSGSHKPWGVLWSCSPAPAGSCSQPALIPLLCAGNINPCSSPGAAALPTLLSLGRAIDLSLEDQGGFWIPAQGGFGTDGQGTNRFPATWNGWKETIAGGKEKNQNQGQVLALPIAAPA